MNLGGSATRISMIYISKLFSPVSTQELQEMILAAENETKDQNDESEVS